VGLVFEKDPSKVNLPTSSVPVALIFPPSITSIVAV